MKAVARPVYSALRSRCYAAQASVQPRNQAGKHDVEVSKQADGSLIASTRNGSQVPRVSVYMNAGPRYETHEQLGYCQLLRTACNMTTMGASSFAISKHTQQMGATLTCSTTRENMVYSVDCGQNHLDQMMEILSDVVCRPRFFSWEIEDMANNFKIDLANYAGNHQARMVEDLHKAAYRDGLGNSLFMSKDRLGGLDLDAVVNYYLANYCASNMSIVGVGVDHEELVDHSKKFDLVGRVAVEQPAGSGYHGGQEIRTDINEPLMQAIVATEGASMESPDAMALMVLQQLMGTGAHVKYSDDQSRIGKAVTGATDNPATASCIMSCYSDSGLFGFQVACSQPKDADKVLRSVASAFNEATKGSFPDEDVVRAKTQLKAAYLMTLENGGDILEDMGMQAAIAGDVVGVDTGLAMIDAVTTADVNKVAKKVINGKPTMSAIGNLSNTPYLSDLFS